MAKICKYEELKKLLRFNSNKISTDTLIEVVEICYFNWNYELAEEIAMSIVNTNELVSSKLVNILLEINKRKITEQGDAVFFPYLRSIQAEELVRKGTIVEVDGLSKLCPENSSFDTSKVTNISMKEKCTYLIYKEVWDENSGELEYYAIPIDLEQNISLERIRIIRQNDIEYYLPNDVYLTDKLLRNIKKTGILHKIGYYNITTREILNKPYSKDKRKELARKKNKPSTTE